ncbi:MAG: hypothetical protein MUQ00_05785 [Candidatus Aminicenantes bacterium]|nr:hypothetical protein [Candidatus Aminicenantes bacterium]
MNNDYANQKPSRQTWIMWILATIGVLFEIISGIFFPDFAKDRLLLTQIIVGVVWSLSLGALVKLWKGFKLKRKWEFERSSLEGERRAFLKREQEHKEKAEAAERNLRDYKTSGENFIIIAFEDLGTIEDNLKKAFAGQKPAEPVIALGSFKENGTPFSLESLLRTKSGYENIPLLVIDTELPFPRKEELARMIRQCSNSYFYIHHLPQIFDPIIVFSNKIIFSFMSKCIIIPTEGRLRQNEIKKFREELLDNCILMHPDYAKKIEYFSTILPSLSQKVVESIRDSGYSFSATHSELWFVEPLKMGTHRFEEIKSEMDREFRIFSREILPVSDEIIANWPLTMWSELSLITSDSILDWANELKKQAKERQSGDSRLKVHRYIYISADQKWEGNKNIIEIIGKRWKDRKTNQEKDYNEVVNFLMHNFIDTPDNYKVYTVFVPSDTKELCSYLSMLAGRGNPVEIKIEELSSNWIIFNCAKQGINILQYEKWFNYEVDWDKKEPFYTFYYDDVFNVRFGGQAKRRVDSYSLYSRLLKSATDEMEKNLKMPQALETQKFHILPIKSFFELHERGQIRIVYRDVAN